ncbi:MAG: Tripartite ATP-independent periplasmic transporter [Syntrophorhabdus sp. PtaB.Bin047]|jgi:TRAP-type C4-dicarboxylate transport system permease small subunit|nr:MAG: Tripartite ATP-independent periplasmic transporter [Syntrophorhabdus sp. PtaB.Bin047]
MNSLTGAIRKLSGWMNGLAGVVLFMMMMLTVVDVALRIFWKPITGTYELVAMAGAVVVGFAVPQTSWDNAHIFVDFLLEKRSQKVKVAFGCFAKVFGMILFVMLGWYLLLKANHLFRSGDVSLTLQIPYYPVAYGLAFCSFMEALVLVLHIPMLFRSGENNG